MKKKISMCLLFVLLISLLVGCGTADADKETKTKKTITFGVTPWSSTKPPTYIAKKLLEDMGYKVKLVNADAGGVYAGLSRGDVNVFMDAWLPEMHANYMEQFGKDIDDTVISYSDGELGWVIPTYVKGIESVEDLKGKEDIFKGKIYGIEEGAGMTVTSHEMIESLGLDLEYVSSSEAGMMAEASRQMEAKEPILFLGWRPHPMFAKYDLKILKSPKGTFETSEVHVLTNNKFKDDFPEAYKFFKNWNIEVNDIEQMILKNDQGKEFEEIAQEWIKNNQDKVSKMIGK